MKASRSRFLDASWLCWVWIAFEGFALRDSIFEGSKLADPSAAECSGQGFRAWQSSVCPDPTVPCPSHTHSL